LSFRYIIPVLTIYIAAITVYIYPDDQIWILSTSAVGIIVFRMLGTHWVWLVGQLICLAVFSWDVGTGWCIPLYLAITGENFLPTYDKLRSYTTLVACAIICSTITIFSSPTSIHTYLMTVLYLIIFTAIALIMKEIQLSKRQNMLLDREKTHLATHDRLTDLLNFEAFHRNMNDLIESGTSTVLMLLDCTDLKSMNDAKGFQEGDQILKQMAGLLKVSFPESLIFARYGGDEFAVVMDKKRMKVTMEALCQRLDHDLPSLLGIPFTYGMASFPEDAATKDDLILTAEKHLFDMKRVHWLKKEENIFRAEKLKIVGELASGMAHEIRNPLTAIKGFMQLSKANGYRVEQWYPLIMDEISRMSELTVEFLQFSKPHASQFKIQPVQDCIRRVISLMESEAIRLGHIVEFDPPQAPIPIKMDQDKFIQLLLNLVKNAFDAMERNGLLQIEISTSGSHCSILVKDNGKGISREELAKIFDPFYTSKEDGTGLGLPICQKIVQDHGGVMEVESTPDVGTGFMVTFPLAVEHSAAIPIS
jgi:diguanylate cyclase (GGDEF)-like protein